MKQLLTLLFLFLALGLSAQTVIVERPRKQSQTPTQSVISTNQKVDLGLSVCWAGYNIGATSPEDEGRLFPWSDPTGTQYNADINLYPSPTPPLSICGSVQYDMATVNWGSAWRMPSRDEMEELISKCKWKIEKYKGVLGFKVTGPNNNAIFLPVTSHRDGTYYGVNDIVPASDTGWYYSGDLDSKERDCAYYLFIFPGNSYYQQHEINTRLRNSHMAVRAVSPK